MRSIPLKLGRECKDCEVNNRWKVIENMEIEIDEPTVDLTGHSLFEKKSL